MIAVQIYIKKNTLIVSGQVTDTNTAPYLTFKDGTAAYTTNQLKGYYVRIVSGTGANSVAWIESNTSIILTLQTPIKVDASSRYEIYKSEFEKLDLFNDEKISVTSSIANANDIGKVFTDYSQSFTIPASPKNNKILSHWYESNLDNGYDHRVRYDGYIKINTQKYKDGNFQLEKTNKKNGFIESYSLTFYGNLTQLKDKFKDTKLRDLPTGVFAPAYGVDNYWKLLNHTYSSAEIKNRITATTLQPVYYPLIGSQRKFSYKDGVPGFDITTTGGAIKWNELYPAVPISTIFSFIQLAFGVTFTGSFFSLDQWTKLFLYLKNSEAIRSTTASQIADITFSSKTGTPNFDEMNLNTSVLTTNWTFGATVNDKPYYIYPQLSITTTSTNYTLYIYRDNLLFNTLILSGTQTVGIDILFFSTDTGIHSYNFKIASQLPAFFDFNLIYDQQFRNTTVPIASMFSMNTKNALGSLTTVGKIEIGNFVPDITINDFITGIVKAFNLMIIPKDLNTFEFVPLEMFYNSGKILDVTQYIYSKEMDVERPKLFKAINLQYDKSENILNNAYRGLYNTEYGDLIYSNNNSNESANYDIKLPFENVLFEKTVGENFETATLIDKDLNPYTPKPMLIYKNGITSLSTPVIMTTEVGTTTFSTYNRFSNEYDSFPADATHKGLMTMNFGNEQSPWYNILAPQGLYFRHYKNYIDNLYNIKTRIIKVKALFPTSILASNVINGNNQKIGIALNDRLIIRNKRYIINTMTTDLTTGEANLELLTDYRGIDAVNTVGYKFANNMDIVVDNTSQDAEVIIYKNDYDYFAIKGAVNFLSYPISGSNEYEDLLIPVTIPSNSSGVERFDRIGIEYYNNNILQLTEYVIFTQLG